MKITSKINKQGYLEGPVFCPVQGKAKEDLAFPESVRDQGGEQSKIIKISCKCLWPSGFLLLIIMKRAKQRSLNISGIQSCRELSQQTKGPGYHRGEVLEILAGLCHRFQNTLEYSGPMAEGLDGRGACIGRMRRSGGLILFLQHFSQIVVCCPVLLMPDVSNATCEKQKLTELFSRAQAHVDEGWAKRYSQ